MLKTLVKCMTKTAENSVKEAVTRKLDEHILLKVQDTDLAAREETMIHLVANEALLFNIFTRALYKIMQRDIFLF